MNVTLSLLDSYCTCHIKTDISLINSICNCGVNITLLHNTIRFWFIEQWFDTVFDENTESATIQYNVIQFRRSIWDQFFFLNQEKAYRLFLNDDDVEKTSLNVSELQANHFARLLNHLHINLKTMNDFFTYQLPVFFQ